MKNAGERKDSGQKDEPEEDDDDAVLGMMNF